MKLLFICTHNRCRSILSEAITNHLADGKIEACSAGSQPSGAVHPLSIQYLQARGVPVDGLSSQSWDDFQDFNPDAVITVCDSAANESCPLWFGDNVKVHWGLPDPSKLSGTDEEIRDAFFAVMDTIESRVHRLLALDLDTLRGADLERALIAIAEDQ
ncbi:arsenate reductase ArsC [Microbulbifer hainanensis]|uniref:arsenate reductase ArsC n=1 Tax=Microbulbifer hainanensis TaxID=2735675 RepID=UPI0018678961|nr:arsenate reductase ArsC [Microbulbifer hainanensis]